MSRRASQRQAENLALKILPGNASVFDVKFAVTMLAPLFEQIELMRAELERLKNPQAPPAPTQGGAA